MNQSSSRDIALGNFIRSIRISRYISIAEIAVTLKISEDNYIQYEAGIVSIYIDHLVIISYILKVDLNLLLDVFENLRNHDTWI